MSEYRSEQLKVKDGEDVSKLSTGGAQSSRRMGMVTVAFVLVFAAPFILRTLRTIAGKNCGIYVFDPWLQLLQDEPYDSIRFCLQDRYSVECLRKVKKGYRKVSMGPGVDRDMTPGEHEQAFFGIVSYSAILGDRGRQCKKMGVGSLAGYGQCKFEWTACPSSTPHLDTHRLDTKSCIKTSYIPFDSTLSHHLSRTVHVLADKRNVLVAFVLGALMSLLALNTKTAVACLRMIGKWASSEDLWALNKLHNHDEKQTDSEEAKIRARRKSQAKRKLILRRESSGESGSVNIARPDASTPEIQNSDEPWVLLKDEDKIKGPMH